jgi:arabinofuranosyltransferase
MGYYASLVPNTAVAKEAGMARWGLGWQYLRGSLSPYWLWIPALILGACAYAPAVRNMLRASERRALLVVGAFVVGGIIAALYIVRVGGDYLHARLLLPSIFALCAPVAVVPLRRWTLGALLLVPWALWCGIALRPHGVKFGAFLTNAQHMVTVDQQGWQPGGPNRAWFTGQGFYYNQQRLPYALAPGVPNPAVASWGIGIQSYALGPRVYTIDMLGLADPFTSHLQLTRRGFPGHEKPIPSPWLVARDLAPTDAVNPLDLPPNSFIQPMIPPTTSTAFDAQVAAARATLRCGAVRTLLETTTRPLSVGTFFSDFGRAFSLDNLRIPPDPGTAQRKFCTSAG